MGTPPPSLYFNGINFNVAFYQENLGYVTREYVDNTFLRATGYAISRALSTTFNNVIYTSGGINTTFIIATGDISANSFTGSGASLSSLNASSISTGTLSVACGGTGANTFPAKRILLGDGTNQINTTGNLVYDTSTNTLIPINISANGSKLTNLNSSNISDGTLAVTRGGTGASSFTLGRILIGNGTTNITEDADLTFDTSTNILTATNISGNGSRLTALNASNVSSGTLVVSQGGSGAGTFVAGQLLIGNTTSAFTQSGNLTWTTATNTLAATNISGSGSGLTAINASNVSSGTLAVSQGGSGAGTFVAGQLLIGNTTSAFTQSGNLTWTTATNTLNITGTTTTTTANITTANIIIDNVTSLNATRMNGTTQILIGDADYIGASLFFISTTGTDSSATKTVYTVNGVYQLSVSSLVASGSKIELIFDNNASTFWAALNNTYTKENALTTGRYLANTTGTINVNYFATTVTTVGVINGEWVQIKYPKRVAISNILLTPQSLPTAIIRGYLLGSNDGTTWDAVYSEFTVTAWTTTTERSLLPTGYTPNTKQYLYYRLVARQIQGVTTGILGATEKLSIATLRFTYNQNVAFIDSVLCIGDPVGGTTPAANCILDINGATNMQGSVNILGNVTTLGNIGIKNNSPLGTLHLGDGSQANNDGNLIFAKCTTVGTTRIFKMGYNSNFDFVMGDAGAGNTLGTWIEQIKVNYQAPGPCLNINAAGKVDIAYGFTTGVCSVSGILTMNGTAGSVGLNLATNDVYANMRVIRNPTSDRCLYLNYGAGSYSIVRIYSNDIETVNFDNSVATFYGGVNKANSVWHNSGEGYGRLYYGYTGETYYKGGGAGYYNGINMAHVFRSTYGDYDIFRITTNGSFSYAGTNQYWSDIRIKKEIEDINDDNALKMILAIEPKTYKYIDGNKSKERVYGFIAQQIKEVVPEAVVLQNNIIPNIYKQCRCEENKKIYVTLAPEVVGKLIQLSELGKYKIVLVEEEYIEVEKYMQSVDIPDGDNMVYGYEVDDFHTINKDYIFTLNVCATQELQRRIEAQKIVIQSQEERIKQLEIKLDKLITYIYQ